MADTEISVKIKVSEEGASSAVTGVVSAVQDMAGSFKSAHEVAAKVVETILKVIETIKKMQEEVEKMRDGMEEAALATMHQANAIDVANLKLQDQIAKLEGSHANNGLSEALLAASEQARALTQALDAALQKSDDLLKKQSIGFLKSLITGQEETKDLAKKITPEFERLKELRRDETLDIEEFQQKNREIELRGSDQEKAKLAQDLIALQNHWNSQIKEVTDGVNAKLAAEKAGLEAIRKARIDELTHDHQESNGEAVWTVAAISRADAEKQVNEQLKVRTETLRELSVQTAGFYQSVKSETENLGLRQEEVAKAEAKRRADAAQDWLRKDIAAKNAQLEAGKKVADARIKQEEEVIKVGIAEHKLSAEEELKQEKDLLNKKFEEDEAFLGKKLAQLKRDPATNANQITAVQGEIEKLKVEHDTEMLKLDAKYHGEVEKRSKKELKDEVERVEEKAKNTKAGSVDRIKILDDEIKKLAAADKASTEEYKRLVGEKAQAEREYRKELDAALEVRRKSEQQHEEALRDQKLSNLDFERQLGRISESQYEQGLRDEITATYTAARKELEAKVLRYQQDPLEYAKAEAELVKLTDKYNADIEKAEQKSYLRRRQQFDQYFKQISGSFNTALNGWMQGTETASQAFGKMFQDIMSQLINFVEQWIEKKFEMWLMDRLLSQTTQSAAATAQIASNAAVAYSGAYAATAAIPFVGPELAPEAAMMAYMDVMAITPAGFALGGIVPATGLALVHEGERILPASMSGRGLPASSGALTVVVNHSVSAVDAESFRGVIRRHGNLIGNEVARVLKKKGFASG